MLHKPPEVDILNIVIVNIVVHFKISICPHCLIRVKYNSDI